ncbi:ABC transporter permease [Porcipelethomonas sp.]|uniref:ABC transporter permease n=1 Tax=Porcipelethomonas sp. TaxID=2981675 RepID=UPI003EF3FAE1
MFENIRLSFKGILSHKVRSFLTMLGIIIGIAAIIAIVSTIKGTNEQIKNNLIGAGNNTVKISLYQGDGEMDFQYQSVPAGIPVISGETKNQLEDFDEIDAVSLYRQRTYCDSIYYMNTSLSGGSILGIDENYFSTAGYRIKSGKGFSDRDYRGNQKCAVIDTTTATSLFGGEEPVGKIIDINGEPFKVIGVAVQSSKFEPVINSYEDYQLYNQDNSSGQIFIPLKSWPVVFRFDEPQNCIIKAVDTDSMTKAGKEAAELLNGNLSVSEDSGIKYKGEDQLEKAKSLQKLSDSTNTLVICIAGISLLVGGIGVMNIMLVSVTERTREIGLKKALGARKKVILGQFLTEAAVLTSIGGIIGIAAGIILAQIISKFADVPVAISGISIAVSVIFSMAVGIIFGLIPSVKAANLDPIDALRYE